MRTHTPLLLALAAAALARAEDVTVATTKGRIRGERVDADMGQYYYAFKGIPYAKPPVKELRFQVKIDLLLYKCGLNRYLLCRQVCKVSSVNMIMWQPPVPVESWEEVRDATEDGHLCPQFDISANKPMGDEDCLTLNVYTPKLDKKKRAVMVYFHGGAFIMGGGASFFFGPGYLLEQNVVLVTFNYR